jgi:hypothetical protein
MAKKLEIDGIKYHVEKLWAKPNSPIGTYKIYIEHIEEAEYHPKLGKLEFGLELEHVRTIQGVASARKAVIAHTLMECYEYLANNNDNEDEMPEHLKHRIGQLNDEIKAVKRHFKDEEIRKKYDELYYSAGSDRHKISKRGAKRGK